MLIKKVLQLLIIIPVFCFSQTAPTLTIQGSTDLIIGQTVEGDYIDDGAIFYDEKDGFLSNMVEVSGDLVNLNSPGIYKINIL